MSKETLKIGPTSWSFTTFFRYFVPGLFTAFWVAIYAIRITNGMGSQEISSVRSLLDYLFQNWERMIGIMIALGSFLGLLFAGIDPIIRAFMGSRAMNSAFKYLLSSKKVDFVYFQFMRLHDMDYHYERLPKILFQSASVDPSRFSGLTEGDYSSRYFFRETIQNYFWDQCLDEGAKQGLTHRFELASTYIYLSFVSLIFFLIQASFYIVHVLGFPNSFLSLSEWLGNYYYVPLTLVAYVLLTLLYNLYYYEVFKRSMLQETAAKLKNAQRKMLMVVSVIVFAVLFSIVASKFQELNWVPSLDAILFVTFFVMFVSFYWSGVFQFSRYVISFGHLFEQNKKILVDFAENNLELIKKMDGSFSRRRRKKAKKRSALLNVLILMCLLLLSTIIFSGFLLLSNPTTSETFALNYSETTTRVLNLTAGTCVSIWVSVIPSPSDGHYWTGRMIAFQVADTSNQTVLDDGGIAGTNQFLPMFLVARQNGSYAMHFRNLIGDPIGKTVSLSYRLGQPVLGIAVEHLLFYASFTIFVLILVVVAIMLVRRVKTTRANSNH